MAGRQLHRDHPPVRKAEHIRVAHADGGDWHPLRQTIPFHDPGYRLVQTSRVPRSFLATSLERAQPVLSVPASVTRAGAQLAAAHAVAFTRFGKK